MRTSRLLYKSTATADVVTNTTLRTLESQAALANSAKGITGLLLLAGSEFVQALEGPAREITALFGRIMQDSRHRNVELISMRGVEHRSFDDWHLRALDLYDLPGEKRALMAAKYGHKDGAVMIPHDPDALLALLLDARYLCDSAPWRGAPTAALGAQSA